MRLETVDNKEHVWWCSEHGIIHKVVTCNDELDEIQHNRHHRTCFACRGMEVEQLARADDPEAAISNRRIEKKIAWLNMIKSKQGQPGQEEIL